MMIQCRVGRMLGRGFEEKFKNGEMDGVGWSGDADGG
jgi:hypothetical protein